ncbi:MAG TPA: 16S rRNA (cytidine(1402)-2'-O)-methyltransferase [Acidimicrobiia bacterium]|nr:16S rRNA (cytidine(1402)-2'-O)-methyltransferase [Acidimicrobiia bacterium]
MPGILILCAGPIGNLSDAPPRLAEALSSAAIVYSEDTRRARILLDHLGVTTPTRSYFAGNEKDRSIEIAERLSEGETVALLTDAGTPGISDPGLTAVRAAIEVDATITGVPGPSAVTLAVAVSGLVSDRFVFEGFVPRRGRDRSERFADIALEERPVVLFLAPNRLGDDLTDLAAAHDRDRDVVVCREMTKLHEEVWRGTLEEAATHWANRDVRGEVTVVLGPQDATEPDFDQAVEMTHALIEGGSTPSSAVREISEVYGVSRRELYETVIHDGRPATGDG